MEESAGRHEPQDLDQQRRAMLSALEEAVQEEDYDFATQIGTGQDLISPADLIEYMDVKRRGAEDPVEQRRWGDGIRNFWPVLDGQEFTADEIERLEAVKQRMEFDGIVGNEEEADVTSIDEVEEKPDWEEDEFYIDLPEKEIARIASTVVCEQALQAATGERPPGVPNVKPDLDKAVRIIDMTSGIGNTQMRLVLDWDVFNVAVRAATGERPPGVPNVKPDLDEAIEIVKKYASDSADPSEVTERMRMCLDKHVYDHAEQTATGERPPGVPNVAPDLDGARRLIEKYASSPERAKAMLSQLGFM